MGGFYRIIHTNNSFICIYNLFLGEISILLRTDAVLCNLYMFLTQARVDPERETIGKLYNLHKNAGFSLNRTMNPELSGESG